MTTEAERAVEKPSIPRETEYFKPSRDDGIAGPVSSLALRDKQRGKGANRNACPRHEMAPLTQCVRNRFTQAGHALPDGQSVSSTGSRKSIG